MDRIHEFLGMTVSEWRADQYAKALDIVRMRLDIGDIEGARAIIPQKQAIATRAEAAICAEAGYTVIVSEDGEAVADINGAPYRIGNMYSGDEPISGF